MFTRENIYRIIVIIVFTALFAAIFYCAGCFDAELLEAGIIH